MADNASKPADRLGQILHEAIHESYVVESAGWAAEQVSRVGNRVQSDVDEDKRLRVEVPWLEEFTAFTAPGPYIYISRRLLEVCRTDETVAFVIAHEVAHHRLGHTDIFPEWLAELTGAQIPLLITALYRSVEARLYGPEREVAADRMGIDLCVRAGYQPSACLEIFEVLEKFALDMRDHDIVFGPEESDDELHPDAPLSTKLRVWLWQRTRGYLPLRDRKREIVRHLEAGN